MENSDDKLSMAKKRKEIKYKDLGDLSLKEARERLTEKEYDFWDDIIDLEKNMDQITIKTSTLRELINIAIRNDVSDCGSCVKWESGIINFEDTMDIEVGNCQFLQQTVRHDFWCNKFEEVKNPKK